VEKWRKEKKENLASAEKEILIGLKPWYFVLKKIHDLKVVTIKNT
jgi:hypothetical protein